MSRPFRSFSVCRRFLAVAIACLVSSTPVHAAQVWSGLPFEFNKPSGAPLPPPADQITNNVALTRGISRGLYNAVEDKGYNGSGPSDTEWATSINNPGITIGAANWEALTFGSWLSAYGGSGMVGHNIQGLPAVVHLISDDIYLDLRFSRWQTSPEGAGFTYSRAVAPTTPQPTGDYSGNGSVDAADYTVWRDTLGQTGLTPGSGADGDQDGSVDTGDYTFWKQRFGNAAGAGLSGTTATVPEANTLVLALIAFITRSIWKKSRRNNCRA